MIHLLHRDRAPAHRLLPVGMAAFPGAGALAVVWSIGAVAIASGVLLIALGLKLRSWARAAGPRKV